MAVLESCPKHNMVAYLEKTDGNTEFHEIISFLTRSSIHYALTVSPVVSTTFVEQFWMSAKSKLINNVRYITAKVAGKPVSISEASIRSDLLFNDADGIDSLPNQAIFDAIQLMGFISVFLDKQLKNVPVPLDHFPINALTSKVFSFMIKKGKHFSGNVTPLFDSMLVQPTEDEGDTLERQSEPQPIPSPPHPSTDQHETQTNPSPRPSPTSHITDSIPEGSGGNHGGQSSNDRSLSGNEGGMTLQSVYDLCISLCTKVTDQAKEIKHLKAQIKKLKKKAKPIITHHKAWMKSVSMKQRLAGKKSLKKQWMQMESVSKQGRKSAKAEPTVHKDPAFDELDDDAIDYMETEDAQDVGRTRYVVHEEKESAEKEVSTEDALNTAQPKVSTDKEEVSTDRPEEGTDKQKVSTDKEEVSTDRPDEGTVDQNEGRSATQTAPTTTTPTIFGDDETIAQVLIIMSQNKEKLKEKEKGVELKDVEETERPRPTSTRSLLTLKPLPKIDPKDKGKKKIEEEDESDTESEGITEAEKKFKQLARDEEVARKVQEDWEAEEEVKKLAEEEATKAALSNEYDFIQARLNADKILAEKLQEEEREMYTIEQRAKLLHDTIAAQRRFLAQQRSEAIRNKPPSRNQLRNQMMTYLKHVDERKIKEINEGASDPDKKKKFVKEDVSTKVHAKQDEAKEGTIDSEIMERKSVIARLNKVSSPDGDYLVIYRANENFRAFNYLLEELLQRMLDFGLEVKVESTAALDLIRVLNSPCFMVKSWLVQDQTVSGKDYSNLLIADSLLKTIWFINAPCYGNEALASPKANDIWVLVIKPHNKTPYELIRGRTPLIDFMKPFGYPVTILNTKDNLGKFDGKVDEGFFVGKPDWLFDVDSLTISMNYVPVIAGNQTNGIAGTRDNIVTGQAEKKIEPKQEYILIPICTTDPLISQGPKDSEEDAGVKPTELDESEALDKDRKDDQDTGSYVAGPSFTNDDPSSLINATRTSEELLFEQFSPFKNAFALPHVPNVFLIDDTGIFGNAYDDEDVGAEADPNNLETTMNVSLIPKTIIDKDHPKDQIIGDLNSAIQTRRMTKISDEHAMLPNGKRAIRTKWVFRNKKDERGIVIRNKARLVAQGYTQEEGIDYDVVFVPVARIEAIRLFYAYASFMGFIVYQMDVKSVEKAFYGLHQAPRAWYETLSTYLIENRFRRCTIDKTVFIKKDKGDILLVQVYVDDIIFGFTKKSLYDEFEGLMHKRFQMSSMGELTFFLGLQVKQKEDGIFISQDKYVAEILKKFDFATINTTSTPIETNKALVKDEEAEAVDVYLYISMIGSLMYLTASRPDIMFAVCACARFQVTPKMSHLYAMKRIFRYLKGQPKLGLWYLRDSPFDVEAFFDSDYAGASLDRKSTIGGCQFLSKRLIS
ncbi:putative ribonuclease H-like domain-containing protein [Tanacetum coccineum]|uniref:Ribonuclease H-like domain-containing protein n=1 Tax=Tanacetum coccineum TaxID=301880 RepID=A0ABQ5EX49_9ASTR